MSLRSAPLVSLGMMLLASPAHASGTPWTFGKGLSPCSFWTADLTPDISTWLSGFFTGLNASPENRGDIGHTMTLGEIVAAVRAECVADPKKTVEEAATVAYIRIGAARR